MAGGDTCLPGALPLIARNLYPMISLQNHTSSGARTLNATADQIQTHRIDPCFRQARLSPHDLACGLV